MMAGLGWVGLGTKLNSTPKTFLKSVRVFFFNPLLDKEAGTFVCAEAVSVRALLSRHLDILVKMSL